jgi:choline transporter-like protein 2/4/5
MARVEGVERRATEGESALKGNKAAQTFKRQSACCNDPTFAVLFLLNLVCLGWLGLWTFEEGGGVEGHVNRTGALFLNPVNGSDAVDVTFFGHNVGEMELLERFTQWLVDESENVKRDVRKNFDLMAMAGVIGICVGITWLQLLKRLTSTMVHLTMMLVVVTVTGLGFLFHHYSDGCLVEVNKLLSSEEVGCVELSRQLSQTESDILKVLAYAVWVVAAGIFIAIFVLRSKVALTVTIFEEACASCLTNMGIYPVTVFVIMLVLLFHVFWASTAVYLFSLPGDTNVGEDMPAFIQSPDVPVRLVLFYFAFSYFWVCAFLRALFHASVAGIVGNWYFNRHHASVGSPLISWWRPLWANLTVSHGSLAMGSFAVAICSFLRYVLKKVERWSKSHPGLTTAVKCCKCCMWCAEKFVKFVNQYAYVYVAMERCTFCAGAKKSFKLISEYPVQLVVMKSINGFVLMCGKLFLTCFMLLVFVMGMESMGREFCGLFVFLVGIALFQMFKIQADVIQAAVDTVFVCYVLDLSLNDGEAVHLSQSASGLHQKVSAAVKQYEQQFPEEIELQKLPGKRSSSATDLEKAPVQNP